MHNNLKRVLIVLGVLVITSILALYFNYSPSEYTIFPKCPFYTLTGLYCPGCGSQRAIHQILNGNILKGLSHNFLIILLILVLIYDAVILILNKTIKKAYKNILHKSITTYLILITVILFWLLRNIDLYPFSILAP